MTHKKLAQTVSNTIRFATWNVNGLQDGTKKTKGPISFLQELHFKSGQIEYLKRFWIGEGLKQHFHLEVEG